jgi:hypothetical protein
LTERTPTAGRMFPPTGIWFRLQRHFLDTDRAAQTSTVGIALWLYLTAFAQRSGEVNGLSPDAVGRVCSATACGQSVVGELEEAGYVRRDGSGRLNVATVPEGRFWTRIDCGLLWNGGTARPVGEGLLLCAAIDRCATLNRRRGHLRSDEVAQLCRETRMTTATVGRLINDRAWRQRTTGITVVGFTDHQITTNELISVKANARNRRGPRWTLNRRDAVSGAVERERANARERKRRQRAEEKGVPYEPSPIPGYPELPF